MPLTTDLQVDNNNNGTLKKDNLGRNLVCFNTFIFERQVSGRGAEREGDTESEAGSRLLSCQHSALCGAQTHEL